MKNILLLLVATAACFTACMDRPSKEAIEKDKAFKDSIARADGDRVLGNIRFGVDKEEFKIQQRQFLKEHKGSIYGHCIQRIEGEFTQEGKLYQVKFVSDECKEHPLNEYPFRDFLTTKFGMEFPAAVNRWIVGDRSISIKRESTVMELSYTLNSVYTSALASQHRENNGTYSYEDGIRNCYVLYFVSDSLRMEDARRISKQRKMEEEKKNEEMRQKQQNIEKQKENDLKSL